MLDIDIAVLLAKVPYPVPGLAVIAAWHVWNCGNELGALLLELLFALSTAYPHVFVFIASIVHRQVAVSSLVLLLKADRTITAIKTKTPDRALALLVRYGQ